MPAWIKLHVHVRQSRISEDAPPQHLLGRALRTELRYNDERQSVARARDALPLIVVPQFGPESATEEMLRRRILADTGLPYVHVQLDPSWHLAGDLHPDSRAAQAIAIAVARRLHGRYAEDKTPGRAYSR